MALVTDWCAAAYIEEGDHIVIDGEPKGEVKEVKESDDYLLLCATDDEGEVTEWPFAPFDPVEFVAAFDDEVVEIPDVEV